MPKQSDDLTQEGDEAQETESGLTIPVPTRDQISSALRKASQPEEPEGEPPHPQSPDPGKQ